jgi:hypothetical protein
MQKKHMHPHTGITDSKPIDGKMKEFYPRSILHNVWSTKGKAREEKHGFNQKKKKSVEYGELIRPTSRYRFHISSKQVLVDLGIEKEWTVEENEKIPRQQDGRSFACGGRLAFSGELLPRSSLPSSPISRSSEFNDWIMATSCEFRSAGFSWGDCA